MAAELYRLVWTRPGVGDLVGHATSRENAMKQFDNCTEIRRAAGQGRGRLRVLRASDYRPS